MILFKLKYASQKIIYSKYILTGNTKKKTEKRRNYECPFPLIYIQNM